MRWSSRAGDGQGLRPRPIPLVHHVSGRHSLSLATGAAEGAADGGNSANAHLCQQGGWQDLTTSTGESFVNTGDCVSYAARGGVLAPKPTPMKRFQATCEESGGTFDPYFFENSEFPIWACLWFAPFEVDDFQAIALELAARCIEAGGQPFAVANPILFCSFQPH